MIKNKKFKKEFKEFREIWFEQNKNTQGNVDFFEKNINSKFGLYIMNELFEIKDRYNLRDLATAHDLFALSHYTGISYEKATKFITGDNDGGIDSYYYDEIKKELFLFQTKLDKINDSFASKISTSFNDYIRPRKVASGNKAGINVITEYMNGKPYVKVNYICIQPGKRNESSIIGKANTRIIGWEILMKEAVSNINKNVNLIISEYSRSAIDDIRMNELGKVFHFKVSINEFISKLNEYNQIFQETLFNANIRGDVSTDKKVFVKGFKDTIDNFPERFELYNNGITIVCRDINADSSDMATLIDPQIINGQQTTRNLLKIFNTQKISDKANVYIKAIKTDDDNLIVDIAKYSNAQSKVKESDLISTTTEFKKLSEVCATKNYYLSAKEGRSKMQEIYKKLDMKHLEIDKIVKIYVAIHDKANMAKAKNSIGNIIKEYIRDKKFSSMELSFIEEAYSLNSDYKRFVDFQKKKIDIENDKESAKQINKIWAIAELAIYNMLWNKVSDEEVAEKILNFYKKFTEQGKDSIMNSFKSSEAYKDLGLI